MRIRQNIDLFKMLIARWARDQRRA